jgi:hypothetical protein
MSTIDSMIQETMKNVTNTTVDAIMDMVVRSKAEHCDRANDYEVGADDAVNDIIRKLHIFKMKLNGEKVT